MEGHVTRKQPDHPYDPDTHPAIAWPRQLRDDDRRWTAGAKTGQRIVSKNVALSGLMLATHLKKNSRKCWPSLARLCELTGIQDPRTIQRHMAVLERAGHLTRHTVPNRPTVYEVHIPRLEKRERRPDPYREAREAALSAKHAPASGGSSVPRPREAAVSDPLGRRHGLPEAVRRKNLSAAAAASEQPVSADGGRSAAAWAGGTSSTGGTNTNDDGRQPSTPSPASNSTRTSSAIARASTGDVPAEQGEAGAARLRSRTHCPHGRPHTDLRACIECVLEAVAADEGSVAGDDDDF
jgi:Helix-turn-helix domain